MGMRTLRVDSSDSTGAKALRTLAGVVGGQVGQRLQHCLRVAKL